MEHLNSLLKVTNLNRAVLQLSAAKPITSVRTLVAIETAWGDDKHI
jgi:hypothetical protein